ncbi:23S rRNA (adenine(2503)-C(2))-methyltransferase RlmN [Estrella lausannensis]|uniref:Probable dual-specificity RNA methyltransferase RlmN n=1 Tax=Estrella lausannensis TaxID=483423 RepID=A0A0H5DP80_9BACT|nr:23S rRNA (adenine(2503)-C(2))-methyltransferase RlmN [Estrella lausannensis]CRX38316.1 Radical SAM superfamily protein [Estrella lausannensis]
MQTKLSALDLSSEEWNAWLMERGHPRFAAAQIMRWIFCKGVVNPSDFTNLSLKLRDELAASFSFELPLVDSVLNSSDASQKVLLKTCDGQLFEMVIMPADGRVTLCISSQVGCKMGCGFCQTGKMGFKRNLTSGEILSQLILANRFLNEAGRPNVSNVVFMGMGEPLDNYEAVVKACQIMIHKDFFALSKHRVTVSTSGLVPEIRRLGVDLPVRLAISLHSPDDVKRSTLMPINRRYPLDELKKALLEYPAPDRYGITFEYIMIDSLNDSIEDAKKLVRFVHGLKVKVNLIPMNPFPGSPYKASSKENIRAFQLYLSDRSIPAPVRYSRGPDVSAACGQLAAKRKDELEMDPRVLHRQRRALKVIQ